MSQKRTLRGQERSEESRAELSVLAGGTSGTAALVAMISSDSLRSIEPFYSINTPSLQLQHETRGGLKFAKSLFATKLCRAEFGNSGGSEPKITGGGVSVSWAAVRLHRTKNSRGQRGCENQK